MMRSDGCYGTIFDRKELLLYIYSDSIPNEHHGRLSEQTRHHEEPSQIQA
jgi:hypothetical protein